MKPALQITTNPNIQQSTENENENETQTERITLLSRTENIFLNEETAGTQTEIPQMISVETQTESLDELIKKEATKMLHRMLNQLNEQQ